MLSQLRVTQQQLPAEQVQGRCRPERIAEKPAARQLPGPPAGQQWRGQRSLRGGQLPDSGRAAGGR
eukprot:scaffold560673_cov36-Prasinocladus_malaysianus.AAC.1